LVNPWNFFEFITQWIHKSVDARNKNTSSIYNQFPTHLIYLQVLVISNRKTAWNISLKYNSNITAGPFPALAARFSTHVTTFTIRPTNYATRTQPQSEQPSTIISFAHGNWMQTHLIPEDETHPVNSHYTSTNDQVHIQTWWTTTVYSLNKSTCIRTIVYVWVRYVLTLTKI
jgi:hypothetical protein